MKTVTMDWETYQKEIGVIESKYEESFEAGAIAADKRVEPVMKYLRSVVRGQVEFKLEKLHELMFEASEL